MSKLMEMITKKKQELEQQSGRRAKTVKPNVGKNRYRILPTWRAPESGLEPEFWKDFGQHFIKDATGKLVAVYVCTEKSLNKPCQICEAIDESIMAATSDSMIETLKEAKSKGRVLLNALVRDGDNPNVPVILDLTPTTFEKVLEVMQEYGDITDLKEGTDIVVTRSGSGLNTEYTVMAAAKSVPVPATVLKQLHNLDDYAKQEFESGAKKALAAVSAVSGRPALTAPSASAASASVSRDVPATPITSISAADDVIEGELGDDLEEALAGLDDDASVAATTEALADDELDAMLAQL